MNIALEGIRAERGQMHPVVATITTLVHAVHFDTGPDDMVISGSTIMLVVRGMPIGQGRSRLTTALPRSYHHRANGGVRPGANEKRVRVLRIDGHRPDLDAIHGRFYLFPCAPRIFTTIESHIRTSQNAVGIIGVHARARTLHSEGMGFLIRFHIVPPSGLHDRPPPTVPTQSV